MVVDGIVVHMPQEGATVLTRTLLVASVSKEVRGDCFVLPEYISSFGCGIRDILSRHSVMVIP